MPTLTFDLQEPAEAAEAARGLPRAETSQRAMQADPVRVVGMLISSFGVSRKENGFRDSGTSRVVGRFVMIVSRKRSFLHADRVWYLGKGISRDCCTASISDFVLNHQAAKQAIQSKLKHLLLPETASLISPTFFPRFPPQFQPHTHLAATATLSFR